MKQLLLLLLLTSGSEFTYSQSSIEFDKFKTGTFTYEGKEAEVEIIRDKNTQTEIFNKGKSKLILSIEWLNDSTYVLTHKTQGCLDKGDMIKATTVEVNGNSRG